MGNPSKARKGDLISQPPSRPSECARRFNVTLPESTKIITPVDTEYKVILQGDTLEFTRGAYTVAIPLTDRYVTLRSCMERGYSYKAILKKKNPPTFIIIPS